MANQGQQECEGIGLAEPVDTPEPNGHLPVLYQSSALLPYDKHMIHAFTGKPWTVGGPGFERSDVLNQREAICVRLGLPFEKLVVPSQTHSKTIRPCDDTVFDATDGILLTRPGIPVMLMFADCTPVVLYAPKHHKGAVIHAGWRGTALAIAVEAVHRLEKEYGVPPEDVIAAIGPSIARCCYEVSAEVAEAIAQTLPAHLAAEVVMPQGERNPYIDLKRTNALQLQEAGVGVVDVMPTCTRCETEALWSYRRGENGRQAAVMMLL